MRMKDLLKPISLRELRKDGFAWRSIAMEAKRSNVSKQTVLNKVRKGGVYEARTFFGLTIVRKA